MCGLLILIASFTLRETWAKGPNCESATEISPCYQKYYPVDYEEVYGHAPNEEELKALCRKLIPFKRCVENYMNECTLQNSSYVKAQLSVVEKLCDEDSPLRNDYLESVPCYKRLEETVLYNECMYEAYVTYNNYWDFLEKLEDPPKFTYDNRYCLMNGYILGCMAYTIKTECGEKAQDVFLDLVQQSATLSSQCLQIDRDDLNNRYVDFLEEDLKPHFSYAFKNMIK